MWAVVNPGTTTHPTQFITCCILYKCYRIMSKEKVYRQNDMECRPYMASIKDIKEIEADEWSRLLSDIINGDSPTAEKARKRLITGCLPMVVRLASQYDGLEGQGVKRIDLIGAGNLMLTEVVNHLVEDPGVAVEAYLVTWVRKAIRKAVSDYLGYVTLNVVTDSEDYDDDDAETVPTLVRCRSLDDTLTDESATTLADTIDDDASADAELNRESARQELMRLLNRWFCYEEAGILYDTFLSDRPLTMKQCMKKYNLTLKQVRGIRESAINRLQREDRRTLVASLLREIIAG